MDLGIVPDDEETLKWFFRQTAGTVEMLVSTGGVGPGKFDGCAAAFVAAGGRLFYRKLSMRPGGATVFGTLNGTLYFGLPGPPAAVSLLFSELVATALDKMRGLAVFRPQDIKAHLCAALTPGDRDCLYLCEGLLTCVEGALWVRPSRRSERAGCIIVLQPGTLRYETGDLVTVHLIRGLAQGLSSAICSAPV